MKSSDIKLGGVYRIRQWEDMAEEFGEEDDTIPCTGAFVRGMRYLCGQEVEILHKSKGFGGFEVVGVKYLNSIHNSRDWTITPDMLEPCEPEEELPDVDPASIFVLLGG